MCSNTSFPLLSSSLIFSHLLSSSLIFSHLLSTSPPVNVTGASGFFGASCKPCPARTTPGGLPCGGHGKCDDGRGGAGTCACAASTGWTVGSYCTVCGVGWNLGNKHLCTDCVHGLFGPHCNRVCPGTDPIDRTQVCCGHGACFDEKRGNGTCTCVYSPPWKSGWTGGDCCTKRPPLAMSGGMIFLVIFISALLVAVVVGGHRYRQRKRRRWWRAGGSEGGGGGGDGGDIDFRGHARDPSFEGRYSHFSRLMGGGSHEQGRGSGGIAGQCRYMCTAVLCCTGCRSGERFVLPWRTGFHRGHFARQVNFTCIKYFSLYLVYVQCKIFALTLTF